MATHTKTVVTIPQTRYADRMSEIDIIWAGRLLIRGFGGSTASDYHEVDAEFLKSFWISRRAEFRLRLLVSIESLIKCLDRAALLSEMASWLHDH